MVNNTSYCNPASLINNFCSALAPNEGEVCEKITSAITTPFSYLATGLTSIVNTLNFNRADDQKPTDEELMKLKPKDGNVGHDEVDFNEIWQKRIVLFTLVKKLPGSKSWKDHRIETILRSPGILDQLDVEVPLDEVKEIFDTYNIIVLRKPSKDKLMNYCGNRPIYSSAMRLPYYDDHARNAHRHEEYDTIDCDLLMNPTIVAEVNSRELERYLNSISHKYREIEGDVMSVIHSSPEKEIPILSAICKEKAIMNNVYSIETKQTKKIKEFEDLARIHGFVSTKKIKNVEIWALGKSGNIELHNTIEMAKFSFRRNQ